MDAGVGEDRYRFLWTLFPEPDGKSTFLSLTALPLTDFTTLGG